MQLSPSSISQVFHLPNLKCCSHYMLRPTPPIGPWHLPVYFLSRWIWLFYLVSLCCILYLNVVSCIKWKEAAFICVQLYWRGFPGGSVLKNIFAMQGTCRRLRFDPWIKKIPWRRAGQPLQYSCLENPMDRGAWQITVHGVTKRRTQLKWLNTHTHTHTHTHTMYIGMHFYF